jgi:alpha-L-rhamnosidase
VVGSSDDRDAPSTASWLTAPGTDPQHPLLRRTFTARASVRSARLLVTGLGAYHAHLNGSRVSADELAPGQTHFGKTVLLNAYEVRELINEGTNALAIEVGRGFFAMNTRTCGAGTRRRGRAAAGPWPSSI